jgi:long-subunit acyl-CoA synthetase (AMP-forming)
VLAHLPLSHATERAVSMAGALRWGYTVNIATEPDLLVTEMREVQPTVFVTTAEVWNYLAGAVQARLAHSSRFKRWLGRRGLARGRLFGPLGSFLWFRPARRQLGLARLRCALCSGIAPDSEALALFAALGVPIVSTDSLTGARQ